MQPAAEQSALWLQFSRQLPREDELCVSLPGSWILVPTERGDWPLASSSGQTERSYPDCPCRPQGRAGQWNKPTWRTNDHTNGRISNSKHVLRTPQKWLRDIQTHTERPSVVSSTYRWDWHRTGEQPRTVRETAGESSYLSGTQRAKQRCLHQ